MQQKQQRAVGHTRQAGAKAAIKAFEAVFVGNVAFDLFPVHAKGRVGEHVVELAGVEVVVGERVAQLDVADILPFDEHVGLADGVAFGVQLLTKGAHDGLGVQLVHILHARRQKATRPRCWVINGADDAGLGEGFVVFHEHQRGGQAHDVARGEVFASSLVGAFGKFADQLFKHQAHLVVGNGFWVQVHGADFLHHLVEQVGVVQKANEFGELEVVKNLACVFGKALDVALQIGLDARLAQGAQVHGRGVEKA